jgi:hypothetical protein
MKLKVISHKSIGQSNHSGPVKTTKSKTQDKKSQQLQNLLSNSHTTLHEDLGATNGSGSLRLTDHDSQLDGLFSSLKRNLPFELEAQLLVIRLINLRTTLEVRWNVSCISLYSY